MDWILGQNNPSNYFALTDNVPKIRQQHAFISLGKGLETVWCPDQQDDTCKLDHLLCVTLLSARV